jgi:hypothetical protein
MRRPNARNAKHVDGRASVGGRRGITACATRDSELLGIVAIIPTDERRDRHSPDHPRLTITKLVTVLEVFDAEHDAVTHFH